MPLSSQLFSDLPLELGIFTSIASLKKKVIMPPVIVVVKNCVKTIVLSINFSMKKKIFKFLEFIANSAMSLWGTYSV